MRALLAGLLLAAALPAVGQPTVVGEIRALRDRVGVLEAKVATLEEKQVKDRDNIQALIAHADILVRYAVELECNANKNMASVLGVFSWFKPFELGAIECPPAGQRYYLPYYLSPNGPILPPAQ